MAKHRGYPVEVVAEHLPDATPLETDAAHVVVGDLDELLEAEHARRRGGQLVQRDLHQRAHELDDRAAVEADRVGEDAVDRHEHTLAARLHHLLLQVRQAPRVAANQVVLALRHREAHERSRRRERVRERCCLPLLTLADQRRAHILRQVQLRDALENLN